MMPVGFGAGLESGFSDVQKFSEVDTFDKELTEGFAGDDYDSALSEAFSPGERFHKSEDTGDGVRHIEKARYYDDAGKEYRVGNELLPNNTFEINGFRHSTDEYGRVVSVEGTVHLENLEGRLPIQDSIEDPSSMEGRTSYYSSLDDMKHGLGMDYSEIKAEKPPHSPNLAKWFDAGGSVQAGESDGHSAWTFRDHDGKAVTYIDGYPVFPQEAKHEVIGDLNIGSFTGDRIADKQLYLEKLQDEYGLTEIPSGYALHHDSENGNMQLVKMDWHSEFTHTGGHSRFKEAE